MRIAVVLAGLVCMVVGAAIDRRGLGGWDLDSDIDRLTAGAAAVLVGAGLLALGSGRKTRVLTGLLAGAAIVPTAMAVTEAVDTGLPGPSTGVLAVGSAVVVLGVAARALEWKHGTASNRIRRIVAMVVAATATALAASAAAALVVDVPVQAVTTSAVQPAAVGVRADVVRWEWRGGGAMRDVRAAGAEELGRVDRAAGFPIAEVDGRIQLVAGGPSRAVATMDLASGALVPLPAGCAEEAAATVTDTTVLRLCRREPFLDVQTGDATPVPLNLRRDDPLADAFIVPAPGAVVVGAATNGRARLIGMG